MPNYMSARAANGALWSAWDNAVELLGYIPSFLDPRSNESATRQISTAYAHGGGWQSFHGFILENPSKGNAALLYPGDPPMREVGRTYLPLTEEEVIVFAHAWVAVVQKDGSYDVARLD